MRVAPVTSEDWEESRAGGIEDGIAAVQKAAGSATLPAVLLRYQQSLLATTAVHPFVVCEKSRRIGMTWAVGADAVLTAASSRPVGGMDVLYIGYNLDMAREFIDVCAMWAKAFMPAASAVQEFIFKDQSDDGSDKNISAFRIRFASGFEIIALTSKPRSLRGRQGYVIFDEAAFHDALQELVKAAIALLMWGGRVLVISTHDGTENPFNELIEEIRAGKQKGFVHTTTFDDAVSDGLYERIALVKGLDPSPEARAAWIADIRGFYSDAAGEELDVIPRAGTSVYLSRAAIKSCMVDDGFIARRNFPDDFELRSLIEREAYVARWIEGEIEPGLAMLDPKLLTAIGEDFARDQELTVIAVGQETQTLNLHVPLMIEMRNAPITQQAQVLHAIFKSARRMGGACFDAGGNGLGLAEQMQEAYGFDRIEAIKITTNWYLETMPKLKERIEDRTIQMPRDSFIVDDLRALRLVRGVPSMPKKRSGGRHGDAAIALAMLVRAIDKDVVAINIESTGARLPGVEAFTQGGDTVIDAIDYETGTVSSGIDYEGFEGGFNGG